MATFVVAVLNDAFARVQQGVHQCLDGADRSALTYRPTATANSPAWLIWHLTRVQDEHLAGAFGQPQLWTHHGWAQQLALPFDIADTGYGHTSEQVGQVDVAPELLLGYYDATHAATLGYLSSVADGDLERVVDEGWDPPVTLGVRLNSVLADDLQHVGQAAYVLGLSR